MGTIVSALQDLWALSEIMYIEGLAQSLLQSTAHNINTIIIIMVINTTNNFNLEQLSRKCLKSWLERIHKRCWFWISKAHSFSTTALHNKWGWLLF